MTTKRKAPTKRNSKATQTEATSKSDVAAQTESSVLGSIASDQAISDQVYVPRQTDFAAKMAQPEPCVICGEDSAPNSNEQLCWVCRRLKISAWRDSDLQAAPVE